MEIHGRAFKTSNNTFTVSLKEVDEFSHPNVVNRIEIPDTYHPVLAAA